MNRLFAAVAISVLALSGAAFAADAPTAVQKDQAPMAQTQPTTPSAPSATSTPKSTVENSHAKKPGTVKKDKTSMKAPASRSVHLAQAPAASPAAKPADDAQAKKPAVVKKSDDKKATTGTEPAQPSTTAKPATR